MDESESSNSNTRNSSGLSGIFVFVWDFLKVIIIALAIILPVRYFLFQPFIVSGSSMEPNFSHGEYLIIDEISYRFQDPTRGDVVVLRFPKDRKQFFIKRIVGLPGETVTIDNGRVTIKNKQHPQGEVLEEKYLPNQGLTFPHNTSLVGGKKSLTLGADEYLVLGDNRLASSDSRDWGILERKDMIGKVFIRVLPLTEFEHFKTPAYSF
ncbi:MAG: signal peptidase I [Candidatus Doudnabacteria bacterium]|nr:signal peptidase I [Candidatus Doudnabacteria bacterium]